MKRVFLSIFLTVAAVRPIAAQQGGELYTNTRAAKTALIEAPKPKVTHALRNIFLANAVMFGSSLVEANAVAFGSAQCRIEAIKSVNIFGQNNLRYFGTDIGGGQFHPYKHALKVTIPVDLGVAALSYVMHKKHHNIAALLFPVSSASAQFSSAGLKYGAGCF
ncbi:MAG: hypothetical protein ACHQLQ_15195 [Candidatus Acidiferrales bacterium]